MVNWTLADIRKEVRQVTGRLTPGELSNDDLDDYINRYYQYTLPAELKLDKNQIYYEFLTTPNQATYDFDNTNYTNIEPPATIDNHELTWYQTPIQFELYSRYNITRKTPWTGDGTTNTFTTSITGFPITPDTLVITDNTEVFEDTNTTYTTSNVNITGSLGGTAIINYSTGSVSVVFNTAPSNGQIIYLSYQLFSPARPYSVLYYNNQFKFYPIPDTAYRFKAKAYRVLPALTSSTDRPELDQWGPCIVYGTARDIVSKFGEMDLYKDITMLYKEQLGYVIRRTLQNLLNTRSSPNF